MLNPCGLKETAEQNPSCIHGPEVEEEESTGWLSRTDWFTFTLTLDLHSATERTAFVKSSSHEHPASGKSDEYQHLASVIIDRLSCTNLDKELQAVLKKSPGYAGKSGQILDVRRHRLGSHAACDVTEVIPLTSVKLPIELKRRPRDRQSGMCLRAAQWLRNAKTLVRGSKLKQPCQVLFKYAISNGRLEIRDEKQLECVLGLFRQALVGVAIDAARKMDHTVPDDLRRHRMQLCIDELALLGSQMEEDKGERKGEEQQEWDMFLSYRVAADLPVAETIYHRLSNVDNPATGKKWRVFWDRKCLPAGHNWEVSCVTHAHACTRTRTYAHAHTHTHTHTRTCIYQRYVSLAKAL